MNGDATLECYHTVSKFQLHQQAKPKHISLNTDLKLKDSFHQHEYPETQL